MSLFGWSLPPGCGTLPGEEPGEAIELTAYVTHKAQDVSVWWDEDGNLLESFPVTVPADEYAGTPQYTEQQTAKVGQFDWSDDRSDEQNIEGAARAYDELKGGKA